MKFDPTNPVPPQVISPDGDGSGAADHVPPELIRQTGLIFGPEFLADPYAFFPAMHEKLPAACITTSARSVTPGS